jgi:hypothetical protein
MREKPGEGGGVKLLKGFRGPGRERTILHRFLLLDYLGMPVNEPFLRDTVNVLYYDGRSLVYPSVRVRMDFRDPNTVGTLVYHCHLLEHEDKGMMGVIRVEPQTSTASINANPSAPQGKHVDTAIQSFQSSN